MNNFIFSLNSTIPIFLVIFIGYVLNRKGMFNENFVTVANTFNYRVTLPLLLFQDIGSTNLREILDGKYIVFCMVVTTINFFLVWFCTRLFLKDQGMRGAFVQASFRGSAAILGIAFIQNIYGTSGMAPVMIIGAVPLYNIYSVLVLTFESSNEEEHTMKNAFISILKNPIILGIFAGLLGSYINFYSFAPKMITKTIQNFAVMASPLALLVIGISFKGTEAVKKIKPTVCASVIKLLVIPMIFLPIAIKLGFRQEGLVAILVMLGAPTTGSCYIMAKNTGNDGDLTSSIVVLTTLLASLTLTFWIYILRTGRFI